MDRFQKAREEKKNSAKVTSDDVKAQDRVVPVVVQNEIGGGRAVADPRAEWRGNLVRIRHVKVTAVGNNLTRICICFSSEYITRSFEKVLNLHTCQ